MKTIPKNINIIIVFRLNFNKALISDVNVLTKNNIDSNIIHFENSVEDGYYVLKNYHRTEVIYRERGKEYESFGFPSESDALEYLLKKLSEG